MKREEYLHYRNSNDLGYVLFQEFVRNKKSIDLTFNDFIHLIKIWQFNKDGAGSALNNFIKKKDIEFEVVVLMNENGEVIKYM